MANLPETPDYPAGVYQLETSDPVLGGAGGIANRQAEQLGNRTAWLKAKIDAFLDGTIAVFKATKLATARTLSISGAGSGSASFDGSANANITLTLADSGAVAGTYAKVTITAKGIVTGGAALGAADIPNLPWSKITSGTPTTLGGYGITDAVALAGAQTIAGVKTFSSTIQGDISGNAATAGNASTATKLATARTITFNGAVVGSGSFDGSGNLTITTTVGDTFGHFEAFQSTSQSVAATTPTAMRFHTETVDTLNAYNPTNGRFTAPAAGVYEFSGSVHGGDVGTSATNAVLDLYVNGVVARRLQEQNGACKAIAGSSGPIALEAGDYVQLYFSCTSALSTNAFYSLTWFSGRRVK